VEGAIWVDAWQLQCCGEPFAVGLKVAWTLTPAPRDGVTVLLGGSVSLDGAEEYHARVDLTLKPGQRFTVCLMDAMRISELARRSGVAASTLRYYEQAGLLPAGRTGTGYRVYGADALDRLRFIGTGKRLGLPLSQIAELADVRESGPCAQVKTGLRRRVAGRLAQVTEQAAELRSFTIVLREALAHLDVLPDRDDPCDTDCETLTRGDAPARDVVPVACALTGTDQAQRAAAWRAAVQDAERTPTGDGVRLTVPSSRAAVIAALAVAEQECCPFFDFRLELDGPLLYLEVRAPAAAARLTAELFAA
jgi:DNA-binding transcriptional MerR regulator